MLANCPYCGGSTYPSDENVRARHPLQELRKCSSAECVKYSVRALSRVSMASFIVSDPLDPDSAALRR